MRDARALVQRAEIAWAPDVPHLVLGRHPRGAASFYFGEDPVYHLNSSGRLRRAYVDGRLYKAEGGSLIEMQRVRTPQQVELRSRRLTPAETEQFLATAGQRLADVVASVKQKAYQLIAEVPADENVVENLIAWVTTVLDWPISLADSPHVG